MEVKINREIRSYTESMFFGLSMRQFIFSVLGIGVAVGLYFLRRPHFGVETVSWMCILGAVPFALLGTGVTCYETVLPEPVTGYGETLFARLQTGNTVTNSGRFSPRAIRKAICALPAYSMTAFSAPVPYWENAARNIEMRIILWTMLLYFIWLPVSAVSLFLLVVPLAGRVLRLRQNGRRIPVNAGRKGVIDP